MIDLTVMLAGTPPGAPTTSETANTALSLAFGEVLASHMGMPPIAPEVLGLTDPSGPPAGHLVPEPEGPAVPARAAKPVVRPGPPGFGLPAELPVAATSDGVATVVAPAPLELLHGPVVDNRPPDRTISPPSLADDSEETSTSTAPTAVIESPGGQPPDGAVFVDPQIVKSPPPVAPEHPPVTLPSGPVATTPVERSQDAGPPLVAATATPTAHTVRRPGALDDPKIPSLPLDRETRARDGEPSAPVIMRPASDPGPAIDRPASTPLTRTPVEFSQLVERVARVVELQQNQPPPRSIVVELPEIEGLRLRVAIRNDGSVTLAPLTAGTSDATNGFIASVTEALTERGFDLGSDRRSAHDQPEPEDDAASWLRQRWERSRPNRRPDSKI